MKEYLYKLQHVHVYMVHLHVDLQEPFFSTNVRQISGEKNNTARNQTCDIPEVCNISLQKGASNK